MLNRRQFLGALGLPAMAAAGGRLVPGRIPAVLAALPAVTGSAQDVAQDEDFWFEVAQAFTVDRSVINFNNGGVSPAPALVQAAMKRDLDFSNETPSWNMWRVLEPRKEQVREQLARTFGCDAEELALTRNASESLQTCQLGIHLAAGDEVLTTNQDYPRMLNTFKQREEREGIVLKQFSIPTPA